jgi:hypothetical protein
MTFKVGAQPTVPKLDGKVVFYTIMIVFLFCILSLSVINPVLTKCDKFNIYGHLPCMDLMNTK